VRRVQHFIDNAFVDSIDGSTFQVPSRPLLFVAPPLVAVLPASLASMEPTARSRLTLLPDSGPVGKVPTDLEGCDDEADEAAVFAGVQGAGGCVPFGAGGDAGECCG